MAHLLWRDWLQASTLAFDFRASPHWLRDLVIATRIVVFVFCRNVRFIQSKHALDRLYKHLGFCDSFRGSLWFDFDSGVVCFYPMRFRAAQIGRQFAIYLSRLNRSEERRVGKECR